MKFSAVKKMALLLVLAVGMVSAFTGCGSKEEVAKVGSVFDFNGTKITIGTTKLQELVDAGFTVAKDKKLEQTMETEKMPGRTYDIAVYFGKEDFIYGKVACLNANEEEMPYLDSVINNVEISYTENKSYETDYKNYTENILIDGVDLKGLTPDEVDAKLKDKSTDVSEVTYPDGSIYSRAYTIGDCYVSVTHNMETHLVETVTSEMFTSNFE